MKAASLLKPIALKSLGRNAAKARAAENMMAFVADEDTRAVILQVSASFWPGARVEAGGLDRALEALRAEPSPHLLMVDISGIGDPLADLRRLRDLCESGTIVIALGEVNDVSLFRDLMSEGVADYLIKPLEPLALQRAILNALRPIDEIERPAAAGRVVTVLAARGGAGGTTVATTLAWLLANEHGQKVSLVDLDLHFGSVGLALDLAPTGGLPDALANAARVDSLFVTSAAVAESENLSILAAEEPLNTDLPIDPEAMSGLLGELSGTAQYIVLDVPRMLAVMKPELIQAASDIFIVSDLSMVGLRDSMRLLELARTTAPGASIRLVINREGLAGKGQLTPGEYERTIGQDIAARIPEDAHAVAAAVNAGRPLAKAARGSKLLKAMREMARELAPPPEEGDGRPATLIGRLFG